MATHRDTVARTVDWFPLFVEATNSWTQQNSTNKCSSASSDMNNGRTGKVLENQIIWQNKKRILEEKRRLFIIVLHPSRVIGLAYTL